MSTIGRPGYSADRPPPPNQQPKTRDAKYVSYVTAPLPKWLVRYPITALSVFFKKLDHNFSPDSSSMVTSREVNMGYIRRESRISTKEKQMKTRFVTLLLLAIDAALVTDKSIAANLVQNGSFEVNNGFSGWTLSGGLFNLGGAGAGT